MHRFQFKSILSPIPFLVKKMIGSRPQSISGKLLLALSSIVALGFGVPAEFISHIFLSHDSPKATIGQSSKLLLVLASSDS
jgi:hypothetical protein